MEEQREESEFVGDCRELMEEEAAGKGLSLSSKTQTLGCEDANTVEVSDSGVCDVSGTHENPNDGGSATEDSNMDHLVSDEKQVKVDVGSVEDKVHKTFSSDDVERSDAGTVEVKPVDEGEGSEICDDVQRVSKTVKLVDVEMNDETAKSEVKSRNGESHESAGEEETVTSGGNEVTDEKAKCDVEDNSGACDGETLSVAEDKADQDKESAKKSEEDYNKMDVDSKKVNEETVALNEQGTSGSETKDAKHSESAPVPEESTQLIKGDGNKGNPGTVSEVSSAADTCREEERTNVNQKEENGEAMEIDYAADKQLEKDVKVGGVLDNAGNESADAIIFFPNTNQKARNDLQNSMKRGANTKPIPTDLIIEIFSRLPAKSVGRFRSLSKQWCSILSRQDFTELFRSKSCARPRLLFAVERKGVWSFFSSPQSSLSLVVAADSHAVFREDVSRFTCSYASGLFYFRDMWIPRVGTVSLVCNPITGQYVSLPEGDMYRKSRGFIGFDPIEKQFKVLAEAYPFCSQRDHHEILTLGIGELSWRKKNIDCPQYDHSLCEGICINGILYYLVDNFSDLPGNIVRFDLRSEEFTFVVAECFSDPTTTKLINYKGKLGGIDCNYAEAGGRYTLELCLWVLEDVERQEWSKSVYTLPENKLIDDPCNVSFAGVTATGEIVLSMDYTCKPFYVFYFNPERNTLRSVEIQGFGANLEALKYRGRVYAFVDHVEDLNADDSKQLKSSISASRVKHLCSNCKEQEKRERQ